MAKNSDNINLVLDVDAQAGEVRNEIVRFQNVLPYLSSRVALLEAKTKDQELVVEVVENVLLDELLASKDISGSIQHKKAMIYLIDMDRDAVVAKNKKLATVLPESKEINLSLEKKRLNDFRKEFREAQSQLRVLETTIGIARSVLSYDKSEMQHIPTSNL